MRRRLRSLLWRVPVAQEVREELAHHRELRVRELVDRGWAPDAARAEADRRLAGMESTLTRLGERRNRTWAWREWRGELGQDVRFALRQCRLQPGFTAAAVLTLALGIGATTAIFSVVHAVVLKPFPFPDPDRVLYVYTTWSEGRSDTSAGNYDYLRQRVSSLEHFAAGAYASFNLTAEGELPERVQGRRVTWDYFPVFGVAPLHGRTFTASEDRPGADPVVVLSHRFWAQRFGGDPSIVGRQILLRSAGRGEASSGQLHDVIGIMPPTFDEILGNEQLWVPAAFTSERLAMYDEHYLDLYARRRAGVTLAQVNDELARAAEGLRRDHPQFNVDRGAEARVYGEFHTAPSKTRLAILLAAVVLVLLIACANVANLLLARLASRARELAIRAAIGAGRGRIVRQVLTESLVLAAFGGAAGILLAWLALPALVAAAPAMQRIGTAALSTPVLMVALGLVLATTVLVGVLPAWLATGRQDLRDELGDGKGAPGGRVRPWLRQALVGVQAALVITVLAGAALLVRSAVNLQAVPLGFEPSGALVARVGLIGPAYQDPARVKAAFRDLVERLEGQPGVAVAALDSQPPLVGGGSSNGLIPEGRPLTMDSIINSQTHFVTPGYFEALRVPIRRGRAFTADDVRAAPLVMIVNETLARRAFGDENPIGKRIACCEGSPDDPAWKTVVGVASDVRTRGPAFDPRPEFYLPVEQIPDVAWAWVENTLIAIVRPVSGDPAALAPVIRDAVGEIDPSLPVYGIGTFDEALSLVMRTARFNTLLMSLLGLTGLVLAAIGIYGVIAWLVAQRTREIGVRMALGAPASAVVRQVALHGLVPVAVGLAAGLGGAVAAGRLLEAQLFQVESTDPLALGAVVALMLVVALVAAIVPAWRAASIDPAAALHEG